MLQIFSILTTVFYQDAKEFNNIWLNKFCIS
jgi:hypothetical protein